MGNNKEWRRDYERYYKEIMTQASELQKKKTKFEQSDLFPTSPVTTPTEHAMVFHIRHFAYSIVNAGGAVEEFKDLDRIDAMELLQLMCANSITVVPSRTIIQF